MNLNEIIIPDSEKVLSVIENGLIVKSKVSNLLKGKNSFEQSIIIAAPDETLNLLQVNKYYYLIQNNLKC